VFLWGRICCPFAVLVPMAIVKWVTRMCRLVVEVRMEDGSHNVS
jgi:hypothetical protein